MKKENKELEELKKKCEEHLNGWKRERADFLNYKKGDAERMSKLLKYANEELVLEILPILDNFCLAEKHATENEESAGFLQIKKQLEDVLKKQGIEAIEVMGKPFDPAIMEAVEAASAEGSGEPRGEGDVVSEEVQHGYTMHGKVIRPAKVKITK